MVSVSESPASGNTAGRVAVTRIQKIIASRMLASKRDIPCFYLKAQADLTDLAAFRRQFGRSKKVKIGTNDCIICAMARAVEKYPLMAGQLVDDSIQIAPTVNVGLAVAAPQGLVVPVVKNAHKKTLVEIAVDTQLLTDKARSNVLTLADLKGACITLSNLGVYEIESFYAVSPPGQCSIVAVGKTIDTCIPKDGGFVNRKMMMITLAADYKVVTATCAAAFLNCIIDQLQNPDSLTK
ncbi:MAG: 2-oxo acid dehydrogenase subunit E2 [Sedimentisphaerales bacterium]|nr:2-oxo acid dehydrogenase subunit E2 [Sedimentisphaerales bacterium]